VITHNVMFRFSDPDHAAEVKRRLEALSGVVPEIASLWVGTPASGRVEADSFDLALVTTHASWDDLKGYVEHPRHQEVSRFLREKMVARAVVDAEDGEG
jgi:hypothetical protein